MVREKSAPPVPRDARASGPGRPKDLAKRAAILDAARRRFTQDGFDRVSMDQIAADAGVSKLTVYSHFGDKEALFAEAVRSYCETQLPSVLFAPTPDAPVYDRLMVVARAFFRMISAPEAIAGHRMLCSPQLVGTPLPGLFWEAGPMRLHREFGALLERRIARGELQIDNVERAAAQFFTLIKGEPHARLMFGCCAPADDAEIEAHLHACVEMFLRAYGTGSGNRDGVSRGNDAR